MESEEFVQAFQSFQEALLSYLYRITTNKQDAEDLVHDTFLVANKKLKQFAGKSSLKTWVFSIATHLAIDHNRVQKRWAIDMQDQCKEAAVKNDSIRKQIEHAFDQQSIPQFDLTEHIDYCFICISKNLELKQQVAIILKEFYDFDRKEIAEILKLTEGVVKHLLYNARQELQQKFDQRCSLVNKNGVCYQCAQLNDWLQKDDKNSQQKIQKTGLSPHLTPSENLKKRMDLLHEIHPLRSNGTPLSEALFRILHEIDKASIR